MTTALCIAALAATCLILLAPSAILFAEVACSFLPSRVPRSFSVQPRVAVVVPAHNEESGIARTVANILQELTPADRVLVVADNCTDATATVAQSAGAEVICRSDAGRRGKGYALDFAIRHLAADPPKVVLIMDADCVADNGSLRALAAASHATEHPLQADYRLAAPCAERTPYLVMAGFAWHLKNYIRPLGLHRLGLPCQLMGTGMAFPWRIISKAPLATGDLVEDLSLGLSLAREGHSPYFYPRARVFSDFPLNSEGQASQRARWETGHLNTIVRRIPAILAEALVTRNAKLLVLAMDAAVPPLSFLALMMLAGLILASATSVIAGSLLPLAGAALAAALFGCAIFLAFRQAPNQLVSFADLSLVPKYVLSKLALYRQVAQGRSVAWIRSKRDTE
jgi:cellulose synthase/poly-beta-1,6-N-acetylglucosamine synthase-like glycosyltransferase